MGSIITAPDSTVYSVVCCSNERQAEAICDIVTCCLLSPGLEVGVDIAGYLYYVMLTLSPGRGHGVQEAAGGRGRGTYPESAEVTEGESLNHCDDQSVECNN